MASSSELELKDAAKGDNKEEEEEGPPPASLAELYQFTTSFHKFLIFIAVLAATGSGVAMPMMLVAFGDAFTQLGVSETLPGQSVLGDKMTEMLLTFVWIGVGLFGGKLIYVSIMQYLCSVQILQYKLAFLKAVLRQEVAWYDTSSPEELAARFSQSITKVQKGISAPSFVAFEGLGYSLGSLVMAFIYEPRVAGITVATIPILVIPASMSMYIVENGAKIISKAYGKAGGIATEALFSMRTVMSLGIEHKFVDRYSASLSGARNAFIKNQTVFGISVGCFLSAYLIMMVVAVIYGAFTLANEMEDSAFDFIVPSDDGAMLYCADEVNQVQEVTSGASCPQNLSPFQMSCQVASAYVLVGVDVLNFTDQEAFRTYVQQNSPSEYIDKNEDYFDCQTNNAKVLVAIFAIMMAGEGLSMVGQPFQIITEAKRAAAKILVIINRTPVIDSFDEGGSKPDGCRGEIEVKDVKFSYPSAPDHMVCDGFSLLIPAGKTMALCGPSGSGKSTLIQLLERFYDPIGGTVMLDGVDIKTLNVRWLRSQLGLVGQEPVLFQGTIAQNIAYGKLDTATQAEIEEAAKQANAHAFITENMQNGYETEVGQSGGKLSGGQKQRVAIARALIKKPSVLLLDEATSALDNKSEAVVQAALDDIMSKQRLTTIVIAHRLSTIRNADCISVLKQGKVQEKGTYDELMAQEGGLFHNLARKQEELLAQDKNAMENNARYGSSAADGTMGEPSFPTNGNGTATQPVTVVPAEVAYYDKTAEVKESASENSKEKDKEKEENPAMLPAITRLFGMQSDHAIHLVLMFLFSAGACICPSVSFYQMVEVMTVLFNPDPDEMRDDTVRLSILLGILTVCTIVGFGTSHFFNGVAGAALTEKLRAKGMAALMKQEAAFFDEEKNSATELTGFLAEKVDKVMMLTTEQLDLIAQLLGGVLSAMVIIFWLCSWQLALVWLAVLPVMGVITSMEMAFMSGGAEEVAAKQGKEPDSKKAKAEKSANHIVGECVMGIRTVASYNLEHRFYDNYNKTSGTVSNLMKQDALIQGFFGGFSMMAMMGIMGVVFWYAVWLANEGYINFTQAMGPMFVATGAMVPLMKAGALADIKQSTLSAIRLFKLFDGKPSIDSTDEGGAQPSSCRGDIEVKNVVFAYPTAADHFVCNGFSLQIPAGKTVALCGPSGAGKSTLIQLLERFYDPISGAVALDGVDIKTLNVRWLRSQLGLVGQEPVLFQGTIAENIAHGKLSGATQEEIQAAAMQANAHGFITENLQNGYETEVGLKGGMLSGGQKQRVAIARALIKR